MNSSFFERFQSTSDDAFVTLKMRKEDFELARVYLKKLLLIFEGIEDPVPGASGFVISEVCPSTGAPKQSTNQYFMDENQETYEKNPLDIKTEFPEDPVTIAFEEPDESVDFSSSCSPPPSPRRKKPRKEQDNKVWCDKCDDFIAKITWRNHCSEHRFKDLGRVFQCPICDYMSLKKNPAKNHVERIHKISGKELKMVVMDPKNESLISLKHADNLRKLKMSERKVECPICRETIVGNYIDHYNEHEREVANGASCEMCAYKATSMHDLNIHLRSVHRAREVYKVKEEATTPTKEQGN